MVNSPTLSKKKENKRISLQAKDDPHVIRKSLKDLDLSQARFSLKNIREDENLNSLRENLKLSLMDKSQQKKLKTGRKILNFSCQD